MSKQVEEIYKKKNLHQHILDRPDSYIGSTKLSIEERFVFDNKTKKIIKKTVEYNPGLIKIFDEILVNAIDHTVREKTAKTIKVGIDPVSGEISIMNDGPGVPVVLHKEYDVYIPELIFGNLLTSSNYDDTQVRIVGGVNGLGSKCTNIFSKKFTVETVDANTKLHYTQTFSDNMFTIEKPLIKKSSGKSFTKITFLPDYNRFQMKKLTKDTVSLLMKRVYDTTACTKKDVVVYLNDEKLKQKDFISYTSLYTEEKVIYEHFEEGEMIWDVGVYFSEKNGQVSFVNGIDTYNGGKHVDYVTNQIIKKLTTQIESKKKIKDVKPSYIKDRLFVFLRSTIVNPSFTSQSKETLTTNVKDFGIKIEISDMFIQKIYKSGMVEDILSFVKYKNEKAIIKNVDKTSRKSRLNIPKLDDANYAGTSRSKDCTLILTEGDSAKTFAISGLSIIGRDRYGCFPLRGKLLNIREATQSQLLNNVEINNLKKIIGLQHEKKYTDVSSLRYGKIMILSDADDDGAHIKGLVMNFFHTWWPELLEIPGFLVSLRTPIIKTTKGKEVIEFYSQADYENWKKEIDSKKWNIKYYKGLGTSTAEEAKSLFKKLSINKVDYISDSKTNTKNAMLLAFEKKKADDRKIWLQNKVPEEILDFSKKETTYDDFINKELVQFSMSDIVRSIPSIYDGLKPSQRKVIYTAFKKNYQKEIKVAQFGAAVAEATSYHHGEASLFSTIINMAQNYTGSNNINLLKPNGQFGCVDPYTEILMFNGSVKKAKDIRLNDDLMGDDGTPRKVVALTEGVDEMYYIAYENGEVLKVNSEHILTFKVKCHKKIKYLKHKRAWVFTYFDKDTLEMKSIEYLDNHFDEPRSDIKTRKDIVEEYINDVFSRIHENDIYDIKVKDYLRLTDFTKEFLYAIECDRTLGFESDLKFDGYEFGLGMTCIPDSYKKSSIEQRFDMIKGFFNSNKDKIYTSCEITIIYGENLNKELLKDILFIIKSLGLDGYMYDGNIYLRDLGIYHLFNYYTPNEIPFIRTNNNKTLKFKIHAIGLGKFNGWELSGNKRFLLSNFIITHNSRIKNGKDAASPRYIFTEINNVTKQIFNPIDFNILNYLNDDGTPIEPQHYVPVLPLILVNGTQGIGTGFSTFIPPYNPEEIIKNMKRIMKGEEQKELVPYYKGFKGKILKNGKEKSYIIYGVFEKISESKIKIKELPIGSSIEEYIDFIKDLTESGILIKDYQNNCTDEKIDIDIHFLENHPSGDAIYKNLKLYKMISTNNMHLFDSDNKIKKYETPEEILKEFMNIRLTYNTKRKDYLIENLKSRLSVLQMKIRFIEEIIKGSLVVYKRKKQEIVNDLIDKKYLKIDESYDYLLSMQIYTFTYEKIEELKNKEKKTKNDLEEIQGKTVKQMLIDDITEIKL